MSLGIICMSCYIFSHIYVLRKRETSQGEFDWVISNFMTTARFFQMEVRYLLGVKKFEKEWVAAAPSTHDLFLSPLGPIREASKWILHRCCGMFFKSCGVAQP